MNDYMEEDSHGIAAPTVAMLNADPSKFEAFRLSYYAAWDMLYLRSEQNPPAASIPVGHIGWLLYNSESLEIVGADVEDFERAFLPTHPFLKADWREVKSLVSTSAFAKGFGASSEPVKGTPAKSVKGLILRVMDCLTAPRPREWVG